MSAERKTETIPEWKREEIDDLEALLDSYENLGIVDLTAIPSRQLQEMRRELHGIAEIRVSRNSLLDRALESHDEGAEVLVEHLTGHVGVIATDENPFALYQQLEASKTSAPINAGEVAPNDIVIPEGDTGIDPGPFVGELQSVGANARIQEGSIQVLEDSTVLEAGEAVTADLANVLGELGIEPKEVGLDLSALVADGVLFEPEELELDIDEYRSDLAGAAGEARALASEAAIATPATAASLLASADADASAVVLEGAIAAPDAVDDLLAAADSDLRALAASIDDEEALPEELAAETADTDASTDEQSDGDADETADEADATEDDDASEDDDGDAGAALGEMF
ncbi:50S ribosomal protein L10 [Halococcoides cellulosivorans]|uniref:Large ribosomal subunit protein uL10 n=1 Tax=Halococcoides cellulosivorans TaxID=1679096 RepID=A0A2R4X1Y2_9EURY|nr:50S ribosomal protein L10 [Halococcoides cellulosivorans]AWB27809.1 50S ribosomal protein L10 [Halococcoides cellulosivorans]